MDGPDSGAGNDWQPSGLHFALAAIGIPVGILVLSWFVPFMRPRWDSSAIEMLCLIGGLVPALIGVGISIGEWRRRSPGALTGLVVGLAAVPVCLVISWWLAMQGIASHPV
ncbi:MAG: hypothetical protein KGQ61_05200 [Planctomycetes bacterium]|nr:hypothetical protein [Planctomycetota bacterium]